MVFVTNETLQLIDFAMMETIKSIIATTYFCGKKQLEEKTIKVATRVLVGFEPWTKRIRAILLYILLNTLFLSPLFTM